MRVVSLLPSATESLCLIGGQHLLVGRSHECDFPPSESLRSLPVLTAARTNSSASPAEIDAQVRKALHQNTPQSLYSLDISALTALEPDLILTQSLCDVCSIDLAAVQAAASRMKKPPSIVNLNPTTIESVFDDIITIGEAVRLDHHALEAVTILRNRMYAAADYANPYAAGINVAFIEWADPIFIGGHWTPQLIERAGGIHPLNPTTPIDNAGGAVGPIGQTQRTAGKSIRVPFDILAASRPEAIIIAPCGRTLAQARTDAFILTQQPGWHDLPAVRNGRVALVDGNAYFNRPGPRLVEAFEWLTGWLNERPALIPSGFSWAYSRAES